MLTIASLSALLGSVAARAQPVTGFYVGAGAGVDFLQNELFKPANQFSPTKRAYRFDPGPAVAVSGGYGFGNGLRVEIEGDYANNHVSGVHLPAPDFRAGGHEQQYGGFANALYDLPLALPVQPYVGVGAGYQKIELDGVNSSRRGVTFDLPSGSESGGAFAYQGIAGISVPIDMPGLALTAEYRMVGVLSPPDFDRRNASGNRVFVNGMQVQPKATLDNVFNHEILIGLRYAFGGAPPTVAQAPAAPPYAPASRSYLVFFDWDRADLTTRARQIVAEAAAASTRTAATRIEVDGHTDRSGTPAYNEALSLRRARSVEAELVRDGVASSAISIQGFGETHPLIATTAGTREPQNRRVEIILR